MGAKKKGSKQKNKGPKGKKARAKAKLEQVWGETFDEDERKASRLRAGKSRVLTDDGGGGGKQPKKVVDPLSNRRRGVASTFDKFLERKEKGQQQKHVDRKIQKQRDEYASSSDDSSGEDDSDDEMNNGGSFSTLLKRIGGPNKKSSHKMAIDDVSDDSDGDEDGTDDSASESDDSSAEESDNDADMKDSDDENEVHEQKYVVAAEDPYEAHFSKPTLPQLDSLLSTTTQLVPHTGINRKVSTSSLLNSTVEVQMSGALLDSWDKVMTTSTISDNGAANGGTNGKSSPNKKQSNLQTKMAWEQFASGPYQHVRQVLGRNWKSVNKSTLKKHHNGARNKEEGKVFSSLQTVMYPAVTRYADVMISSETRQNRDEINNLLSMHVLNHVLTSRTRVQRHNRRIKELTTSNENSEKNGDSDAKNELLEDEGDDKWRDQGYTRPKVLILLPTRGTCWKFVQQMIQLLGDAAIVDNGERFDEEYGPLARGEDSDEEDDDAEARRKAVLKQKGAEWNELFGDEMNADDDFKMGLSLTPNVVKSSGKKKSKYAGKNAAAGGASSGVNMKLFAEFYRSDIILASPIGLKMATTGEGDGDDEDDEEDEVADVDFLSSIDICLVSHSDVLLMQNWDHVNTILDSLNQQPKKITDIDFSRVRNYFLEGQGVHWRQLIMVSQFSDPYILSTFRRHAKNVEGVLKIRQKISTENASICDVTMVRVKQVFQRVSCQAVSETGTNRLRYFSDHVLPKLIRLKQKHTLIYIPSYFDFIAVRNLLLKREVDFVSVTEYARVSEVSRGRARFLQGRKSIMLYTGRAHFFLRHKIKGARHLILFGLPEYSEFYPAVVNMLNEGMYSNAMIEDEDVDGDDDITRMPMSCLSLFTKFDAHQLERVVGTSHTERMIKGEKSSYMFCS